MPAKFYDSVLHPAFAGTNGIAYIPPEARTIEDEFPAYHGVNDQARAPAPGDQVHAP